MIGKFEKCLHLVHLCTPQPCKHCGVQMEIGTQIFWQRLDDGCSEAWHVTCDPEYIERAEQRAAEDAELDAQEAADRAEIREMDQLDG